MPVAGSGSDIRRQATTRIRATRRERERREREEHDELVRRQGAARLQRAYAPPTSRAPGQGRKRARRVPANPRVEGYTSDVIRATTRPAEGWMRGQMRAVMEAREGEKAENTALATALARLREQRGGGELVGLFTQDPVHELRTQALNQPGFRISEGVQAQRSLDELLRPRGPTMGGVSLKDVLDPHWREALEGRNEALGALEANETRDPLLTITPSDVAGKTAEEIRALAIERSTDLAEESRQEASKIIQAGLVPAGIGNDIVMDLVATTFGIPAGLYGAGKAVVDSARGGSLDPLAEYGASVARGTWETLSNPSLSRPFSTALTFGGIAAGGAGLLSRAGAGVSIARGADPARVAFGGANPNLRAPLASSIASIVARGPAPRPRMWQPPSYQVPQTRMPEPPRFDAGRASAAPAFSEAPVPGGRAAAGAERPMVPNPAYRQAQLDAQFRYATGTPEWSRAQRELASTPEMIPDPGWTPPVAPVRTGGGQQAPLIPVGQGRQPTVAPMGPRTITPDPIQIGNYARNPLMELGQRTLSRLDPHHEQRVARKAIASQNYVQRLSEGLPADALETPAEVAKTFTEVRREEGFAKAVKDVLAVNEPAFWGNLAKTWIWDFPRELFRFGTITGNPAYGRNVFANGIMTAMESGLYTPMSAFQALRGDVFRGLNPEALKTFQNVVVRGEHGGRSLSAASLEQDVGFGPLGLGAANRKLAQGWNHLTDRVQRGTVFFDIAKREGFRNTDDWNNLLTDPKLSGHRNRILNETNEAMVAYNRRLGTGSEGAYAAGARGVEKVARNTLVFFPWMRGSAYWGPRFVREHPVQAGAWAQIGQQGWQQAQEDLGTLPSALWGAFKTGEKDLPGVGKVPLVSQANAFNPFTTWPEIAGTVEGLIGGAGGGEGWIPRAFNLSEYLTPQIEQAMAMVYRKDPFTGADIPEDIPAIANPLEPSIMRNQLEDSLRVLDLVKRYAPESMWSKGEAPNIEGKLYPVEKPLTEDPWEFAGQLFLGPTGTRPLNPEEQAEAVEREREPSYSPTERIFRGEFKERNEVVDIIGRLSRKFGKEDIANRFLDDDGRLRPEIRQAFRNQTEMEEFLRQRDLLGEGAEADEEGGMPLDQKARKARVLLEFARNKDIEIPEGMARKAEEIGESEGRGMSENEIDAVIQDFYDRIYNRWLTPLHEFQNYLEAREEKGA